MPVIPTLGQVVQLADRHNALEGVQDVAGEQQSAVTDLPAKLKPHPKDQGAVPKVRDSPFSFLKNRDSMGV
jgi:hypothetical protein